MKPQPDEWKPPACRRGISALLVAALVLVPTLLCHCGDDEPGIDTICAAAPACDFDSSACPSSFTVPSECSCASDLGELQREAEQGECEDAWDELHSCLLAHADCSGPEPPTGTSGLGRLDTESPCYVEWEDFYDCLPPSDNDSLPSGCTPAKWS